METNLGQLFQLLEVRNKSEMSDYKGAAHVHMPP